MKIWEKLEAKLNIFIESLLSFLRVYAAKSTPKRVKETIAKRTKKPHLNVQSLKVKLLSIKVSCEKIKNSTMQSLGKIIIFFKGINLKKLSFRQLIIAALAVIGPFAGRIKLWYLSLKPATMLAIVSMTTVSGLSSIVIYKEIQKISDKSRTPASEEVHATTASQGPRPVYYKQQERELRLRNVTFPVYISQSPTASKKLVIDFTFVASNKYIKSYFDDFRNTHRLRDKLNTSIEQILPDFPLQQDGKRVIKEKIQKEMQSLIDELKIEGSIEEVYIHSIMAG